MTKQVKIINKDNGSELTVSLKAFRFMKNLLSENSTYEVIKK